MFHTPVSREDRIFSQIQPSLCCASRFCGFSLLLLRSELCFSTGVGTNVRERETRGSRQKWTRPNSTRGRSAASRAARPRPRSSARARHNQQQLQPSMLLPLQLLLASSASMLLPMQLVLSSASADLSAAQPTLSLPLVRRRRLRPRGMVHSASRRLSEAAPLPTTEAGPFFGSVPSRLLRTQT